MCVSCTCAKCFLKLLTKKIKMQQKINFSRFSLTPLICHGLHLSHQSVTMAHGVCYSWIIDSFKVHEISITICLTRWWWKIISMLMSLTQLVWHFSILWAECRLLLPFTTMKFKNIRRNYEENVIRRKSNLIIN